MEIIQIFLEIYETLSYFIGLTFRLDVLWNVIPLALTTILVLLYFQRYKEEQAGWNSYLTNTLILLFVSIALYRHIYEINPAGFANFIYYASKTVATTFLLFTGLTLLKFNFEHLLPKRFADKLSSPLTVHLTAYAVILFVYSNLEPTFIVIISLLILIVLLSILLNIIKSPLQKYFTYLEKEKVKDQIKNAKEAKHQVKELKRELSFREKQIKKMKSKEKKDKKIHSIILSKILNR